MKFNPMTAAFQQPVATAGVGIRSADMGRFGSPSSFVAPNQQAYQQFYNAGMRGMQQDMQRPQGMPKPMYQQQMQQGLLGGQLSPGMSPYQVGTMMPYAQNYWEQQFGNMNPRRMERMQERTGMQFTSPQEYAQGMQNMYLNGWGKR